MWTPGACESIPGMDCVSRAEDPASVCPWDLVLVHAASSGTLNRHRLAAEDLGDLNYELHVANPVIHDSGLFLDAWMTEGRPSPGVARWDRSYWVVRIDLADEVPRVSAVIRRPRGTATVQGAASFLGYSHDAGWIAGGVVGGLVTKVDIWHAASPDRLGGQFPTMSIPRETTGGWYLLDATEFTSGAAAPLDDGSFVLMLMECPPYESHPQRCRLVLRKLGCLASPLPDEPLA